jgi:hypothetical protein
MIVSWCVQRPVRESFLAGAAAKVVDVRGRGRTAPLARCCFGYAARAADFARAMPIAKSHGGGMERQTAAAMVAGWEYKMIKVGPSAAPRAEDVLNELGAVGWELIVFQPAGERAYPGEGAYLLKRSRAGTAATGGAGARAQS